MTFLELLAWRLFGRGSADAYELVDPHAPGRHASSKLDYTGVRDLSGSRTAAKKPSFQIGPSIGHH
jgi:hypothetical protein